MQRNASTRARRWVRYGLVALVTALVVSPIAAYGSHQFDDVPDTNIFHDDIDWMADNGITFGCGGNDYCPKDPVTREQMSAFMRRLAENQVVDAATAITAEEAAHADTADDADTLDGLDSTDLTTTGYITTLETGNVNVPASSTTDVLTLDLPAGSYMINARASMNANAMAAGGRNLTCTLTAGTTSQELRNFYLEPNGDVDQLEVTFMIAHTFDAAGQVVLSCEANASWNGNVINPTISAIGVNGFIDSSPAAAATGVPLDNNE